MVEMIAFVIGVYLAFMVGVKHGRLQEAAAKKEKKQQRKRTSDGKFAAQNVDVSAAEKAETIAAETAETLVETAEKLMPSRSAENSAPRRASASKSSGESTTDEGK